VTNGVEGRLGKQWVGGLLDLNLFRFSVGCDNQREDHFAIDPGFAHDRRKFRWDLVDDDGRLIDFGRRDIGSGELNFIPHRADGLQALCAFTPSEAAREQRDKNPRFHERQETWVISGVAAMRIPTAGRPTKNGEGKSKGIFRQAETPTNMRLCLSILAVMLVASSPGRAAGWRFASGPSRVALLELYTSEGCSSCPPAEEWLGRRRDDPDLWKRYVPISFHVTYWDHLGWEDRLAKPDFTARQRLYAAHWQSPSVYTPCFVRDGAEWHPGKVENSDVVVGQLVLRNLSQTEWELTFTPQGRTEGKFQGYVALLGRGITSRVRAGENKGRTLEHDFVALDLAEAPLKRGNSENEWTAVFKVQAVPPSPSSLAIAAWVARRGELEPVQATGGDLK